MTKLLFNPKLKKYFVVKNHTRISRKCLLLAVYSNYDNLVDIANQLNKGLPKLRLAQTGYSSEKTILNKNLKHDFQRDSSPNDIYKPHDDSFNVEETIKINKSVHKSPEISPVKKTFDDVFYEELHKELCNESDAMRIDSIINETTTKDCCLKHVEEAMICQRFDAPEHREQYQTNLCANIKDELALHLENKTNNNTLTVNQLDQQNSKDKVIIEPELQDNDTDMITKSYKKRLNNDIHDGYDKDGTTIHEKATIQDTVEVNKVQLCQDMENDFSGSLNQHLVDENNREVPLDKAHERQFEFEDALLPDNLSDIQALYDSEKDILTYSANYEISDQLNTILAYQLDGRTVDILRDHEHISDNDNDTRPSLSPVALRPRQIINNLSLAESDNNDFISQKLDLTDDMTSAFVENSAENRENSSLHNSTNHDEVEVPANESINDNQEENTNINSDLGTLDLAITNEIGLTTQKGSCDNSKLTVQLSSVPRWKKGYSCPFCHKIIIGQLPRHIKTVHRNIEDVQKLNNTAKGSAERKEILTIFRNHGSFTHNSNENFNNGQLIVSRRPKIEKAATDYTTCSFCLTTLTKSNARKHIIKCKKKHGAESNLKGQRAYYVMGKSIEGRMHKTANDILRLVVFPVLQDDKIVRLIRYDWLIILYGNKLCIKYTPHYQHNMIRARLRLMGRLLSAAKEINSEITELASLFYPKRIETVIKAIGLVAKINYMKNKCDAPAVALNLVTYIRQIAVILETEYVMQENDVLQKHVSNFLKVYNTEMSIAVNKIASESQATLKRSKVIILPMTEDIQKLIVYIKTMKKNCFDILKKAFDYHTWLAASKLVAAYLLVFNRRRVGDVQNMTISDMDRLQRIDKQADKEEYNALDDDGKKIAANYYRIEIRGKLNRDVAVITSKDIVDEIKLLIEHRESANVPPDNSFVFGLPNGVNDRIRVLNLCTVLRELSVSCGAEKPELLRGTHLRKHVATKCVEFELSDNVLSDLTKHMGHSEKIHKDFYQRPIKSKTIVQVTKLLHAVHGPVTDEDIENEDIFTNDRSEFVEYEDSNNITENENNPDILSETDPDFGGNLPRESVEIPNETEVLFDHNLPCTSRVNNSVVIADYAQILNQSTPKDRLSTVTRSETCLSRKKPWSNEEKRIVLSEMKEYIINRTLPSFKKIDEMKAKYPCLNDRRRDTIKTWISNQYKQKASNNLNEQKGIEVISVENKKYQMKSLKKCLDL